MFLAGLKYSVFGICNCYLKLLYKDTWLIEGLSLLFASLFLALINETLPKDLRGENSFSTSSANEGFLFYSSGPSKKIRLRSTST